MHLQNAEKQAQPLCAHQASLKRCVLPVSGSARLDHRKHPGCMRRRGLEHAMLGEVWNRPGAVDPQSSKAKTSAEWLTELPTGMVT